MKNVSHLPNCAGVYKITSELTGRFYIGSSVNIRKRILEHMRTLRNNTHHACKLQRHYNKYPNDTYVFDILDVCDIVEERTTVEQYYISEYKPYFNSALNVTKPTLGISHCSKIKHQIYETVYRKFKNKYYNMFKRVLVSTYQDLLGSTDMLSKEFNISKYRVWCIRYDNGAHHTRLRNEVMLDCGIPYVPKIQASDIQRISTNSKFLKRFGSTDNFLYEIELVLKRIIIGVPKANAIKGTSIPIDTIYGRSQLELSKPLLIKYGVL